jgi:hypothetical protein
VAGRRRAGKVAPEPSQVLVVLFEEHLHDPARGDQSDEPAIVVENRQRANAVLNRLPGSYLLIDAVDDHRWIGVDELGHGRGRVCSKDVLDSGYANQEAVPAGSNMSGRLETAPD